MITPTTVTGAALVESTTAANLVFNRMNQDYSISSSCETFIEYNMNEYGETPTETVSVSNYDYESEVTITGVTTDGTTTTYTAPGHTFITGDIVTIIGITPNQFNLSEETISSKTSNTFSITRYTSGTYSSGGKASKRSDYYPVENIVGLPFKKLFPIDTIIKQFRPNQGGIKYAIIGDLDKTNGLSNYFDPKTPDYPLAHRVYYPGEDTYYKYWVGPRGKGIDLRLKYPKTILTNKIVIKFETSHSTPENFYVYLSNSTTPIFSGTSTDIVNGVVELYYNGSSWTKNYVWSASYPVSTTDVRVSAKKESGSTDKFIGIIEICPIMRKQLLEDIVSLEIIKDSFSGSEEYLPVGRISANSMQLNLFMPFALASDKVKAYNKSLPIDYSTWYFSKNIVIKPYLILSGVGAGEQLIAKQGTFYLESWTINEFGDITINALDGAKQLQETATSQLLCKNYTVPAIIRYLLDSIGFTNYNFNFRRYDSSTGKITLSYGVIKEDLTITPNFWYTDSNKNVWDALSELCRDAQLTAFFDENNILQFYTKDALFDASRVKYPGDTSSVVWEFRSSQESTTEADVTAAEGIFTDPQNLILKYTAANTFKQGDLVNIKGITPESSLFNRINAVVTSASATQFTVDVGPWSISQVQSYAYTSGGKVSKSPDLPNIISLNKSEQQSSNKIKVIYTSTYNSDLDIAQSKKNAWEAQSDRIIGAGSLRKTLYVTEGAGQFIELDVVLDTTLIGNTSVRKPITSYTGYLAIGKEIIEFDGVEYQYLPINGATPVTVIITGLSDLQQILPLVKVGVENNVIPTGKYRIKERGVFGTVPQTHEVDVQTIINSWNAKWVYWQ